MASNTPARFGPFTVTDSVANLLNPATLTGGVHPGATKTYILLKHIRIVNRTASPVAYSSFIGATGASAAGTEFMGSSLSVAANSFIEWFGQLRLDTADFLTGVAGTNNALTFEAEGEIGIVI